MIYLVKNWYEDCDACVIDFINIEDLIGHISSFENKPYCFPNDMSMTCYNHENRIEIITKDVQLIILNLDKNDFPILKNCIESKYTNAIFRDQPNE